MLVSKNLGISVKHVNNRQHLEDSVSPFLKPCLLLRNRVNVSDSINKGLHDNQAKKNCLKYFFSIILLVFLYCSWSLFLKRGFIEWISSKSTFINFHKCFFFNIQDFKTLQILPLFLLLFFVVFYRAAFICNWKKFQITDYLQKIALDKILARHLRARDSTMTWRRQVARGLDFQ